MNEMTLQKYLKSEFMEARQDQKDRVKFQDKIVRRFNELAAATAKASTKDELDKVVMIVNSWLVNFEALETERLEYLGDIPEGYLVNTWKDFVGEWKPKFQVLKESAEFKTSTINPVEYKQPAKQFKVTGRQTNNNIPIELQSDDAKLFFDRAIIAGLMDQNYNWKGSVAQMTLFAEIMAEKLKLKYKWRPFQTLWNVEHMAQTRWGSKEKIGKVEGEERVEAIFL